MKLKKKYLFCFIFIICVNTSVPERSEIKSFINSVEAEHATLEAFKSNSIMIFVFF